MESRACWILALSLGLVEATYPRDASACQPLGSDVTFVLPDSTMDPQPVDGALLATYVAPETPEVGLQTADGQPVEITASVEFASSHEHALVLAWPTAPLVPGTAYVWSIDGETIAFVTGELPDPAPPVPGEASVIATEDGFEEGCNTSTPYVEHEIAIAGIDEPFAILAIGPDEVSVHAGAPTVRVRVFAPGETCYALRVEDRGGHLVDAGTICLEGPTEVGTTGVADTTDGGDTSEGGGTDGGETSGGDASDGGIESSAGDGAGPGSDGEASSDGAGAGQDITDRGCGCGVTDPHAGLGLLLLAGLCRRRRRAAIA